MAIPILLPAAAVGAANLLDTATTPTGDVSVWLDKGGLTDETIPKPYSLRLYEKHMDSVFKDKGANVPLTNDIKFLKDVDTSLLSNYIHNPAINQYSENTNLFHNFRKASANIRTVDMGDNQIVARDAAEKDAMMKQEYDYEGINRMLMMMQNSAVTEYLNQVPDVSPEIAEEIKRRVEVITDTNDAKYRASYLNYFKQKGVQSVDYLSDAFFGSAFKAIGNVPSVYEEIKGLGLLGAGKVVGGIENISDYFNPGAEQERELTPDIETANGFTYDPNSDAEYLEALAKEKFLTAQENRENVDNNITYRSSLMGSYTVQTATDTIREMLLGGQLLFGRAILKGERLSAVDPATLPNIIKNPKSIFDINNASLFNSMYSKEAIEEISDLASKTFKQRMVTLKDQGSRGTSGWFANLYKSLPIVGQATRHDHLFSLAGAYGPEAQRFSQRLYQYGNIGASLTGTTAYMTQLAFPENSYINNGWFTVGSGLIGGVASPLLGQFVRGSYDKFSASFHLSFNPFVTANTFRKRVDNYLQFNRDMSPELLDEINATIDIMPESAIPQGRFNENGKVNRDGYLHDEWIKDSPRLQAEKIGPDGNPIYDSVDEVAYANAQRAYNRKMNVMGLDTKGVKNISRFISMVHKLRDNPESLPIYNRLMEEQAATKRDIDTLRNTFFDEKGTLKKRFQGTDSQGNPIINSSDLEDLELYLDMYMGNTMLSQFTDMMQESANLGIFGKNIDGLFANDYLQMLSVMEQNLAKLSNMHKAIVKTLGYDDAGNPDTNVLDVFKKLDEGRELQNVKFLEKTDYVLKELEGLQIRTDSELAGFQIDDLYDPNSSIGSTLDLRQLPSLNKYETNYTKITGSTRSTREADMNILGEEIIEVIGARWDDLFGENGTMKALYNNVKLNTEGKPIKIFDLQTEDMQRVRQAFEAGQGTDTPDSLFIMDPHWQGINNLFKKGGAPVKRVVTPTDDLGNSTGSPIEIYVDADTTMDELLRVRSEFNRVRKTDLTGIEGHDAGENAISITKYLDDPTKKELQAANKAYMSAAEDWKGGIGKKFMATDAQGSGARLEDKFTIYDTIIDGILDNPPRFAEKLNVFFDSKEAGLDYVTKVLAHRIHMGRQFSEDDFSKIESFFVNAEKFETSGGELLDVMPVRKTTIIGKETVQFDDKTKELKDMYGARRDIAKEANAEINSIGRNQQALVSAQKKAEGDLEIIFQGMNIGRGRRNRTDFYNRLNADGIDGIKELKETFFGGNYSGTLTEADFDDAILFVVKEELENQFLEASMTTRVIPKVSKIKKDGLTKEDQGWIEQLNIEADKYQQVLNKNRKILEYLQSVKPSVGGDIDVLKGIQLTTRSGITARAGAPKGKILNVPTPTSFSTYQSYGWAWARGVVGTKWIAAQLGRTHIANQNAKMYVQVLTDPDAATLMYKINNGKALTIPEQIKFKNVIISMLPTLRDVYGDMTQGERMTRERIWEKKINAYVELAAKGGIPNSYIKSQ